MSEQTRQNSRKILLWWQVIDIRPLGGEQGGPGEVPPGHGLGGEGARSLLRRQVHRDFGRARTQRGRAAGGSPQTDPGEAGHGAEPSPAEGEAMKVIPETDGGSSTPGGPRSGGQLQLSRHPQAGQANTSQDLLRQEKHVL